MSGTIKRTAAMLLLATCLAALSGCNAARGVGFVALLPVMALDTVPRSMPAGSLYYHDLERRGHYELVRDVYGIESPVGFQDLHLQGRPPRSHQEGAAGTSAWVVIEKGTVIRLDRVRRKSDPLRTTDYHYLGTLMSGPHQGSKVGLNRLLESQYFGRDHPRGVRKLNPEYLRPVDRE